MFNFDVYIKENGDYIKVDTGTSQEGIPVFPLSIGQLLDEQLDEAYITIQKSIVEHYTPLTEVRIDVLQDGQVIKQHYMVVAEDNSQQFPLYE
jgi:hypothetical protein